jgi:hypothetical protein
MFRLCQNASKKKLFPACIQSNYDALTVLSSQCAELLVWRSDRAVTLSSAPSRIEIVFETTFPALLLWIFALKILAATHNHDLYPFLEAFAKMRKTTVAFDMSVRLHLRPSVRTEHIGSHKTDFYEIRYLNIFEKLSRKLKFY